MYYATSIICSVCVVLYCFSSVSVYRQQAVEISYLKSVPLTIITKSYIHGDKVAKISVRPNFKTTK